MIPGRKRDRSYISSPEHTMKRPRHDVFADMPSRNRVSSCPNPPTPRSDPTQTGTSLFPPTSPSVMIHTLTPTVLTTHVSSPTPTDPALTLTLASPLSPLPEETPSSPPNEFRSTPKHAYTSFRPSTPRRSRTPSDAVSPAATPAWARPLHLVDDEVSILKSVHGERAKEHPLCLECFRLHGEFRGLKGGRCEWCGGRDLLGGHYWERCFWAG